MKNKKVELILKVTPKGQVILKKKIRKVLGIKNGGMVKLVIKNKSVTIKPFDMKEELREIEALAEKISRKWPKGLSSVEIIRRGRR
jgi:AbrB family looped-hinge helix DNA binding protein